MAIAIGKEYPASDHSVLLMESKYMNNNEWAIYFADTGLNKEILRGTTWGAIIPESLVIEMGLS